MSEVKGKIIRVDGTEEDLMETDLKTLQGVVGGIIQLVRTHDGQWLVLDEEGKMKRKPINPKATSLYIYGGADPIVGDVAVVPDRYMD